MSGSGDFPDWTSGVTAITGPIPSTADFPDWVVATIQYTTPVVNPGVVTAIPGLQVWYQADAITGLADGANLTSWPDSSGNGHTLSVASATPPVYYKTTAAKLFNGLPAVWFDNTHSEFIRTAVTNTVTFAQPWTVLQAIAFTDISAVDHDCIGFSDGTGPAIGSNGTVYFLNAGGSTLLGGTVTTAIHTVVWQANGGNGLIRVDGTQVAASATVGTHGSNQDLWLGCQFGGSGFMTGAIPETIIYGGGTNLTTAQIQSVEKYLKGKWGTP